MGTARPRSRLGFGKGQKVTSVSAHAPPGPPCTFTSPAPPQTPRTPHLPASPPPPPCTPYLPGPTPAPQALTSLPPPPHPSTHTPHLLPAREFPVLEANGPHVIQPALEQRDQDCHSWGWLSGCTWAWPGGMAPGKNTSCGTLPRGLQSSHEVGASIEGELDGIPAVPEPQPARQERVASFTTSGAVWEAQPLPRLTPGARRGPQRGDAPRNHHQHHTSWSFCNADILGNEHTLLL